MTRYPPRFTPLVLLATGGSLACGGGPTGSEASAEPAGLEVLSGDGQLQFPGVAVFTRLSVGLVDADGARTRRGGVRVTWTVVEGGGSVRAVSDTTSRLGTVRADWVLGSEEGTHRVEAATDGLPPVTFTARAAAPGPIVFVSGRRFQSLGSDAEGYPGDLYVMREDGTDVMPLFPPSAEIQFVFDPVWSRDGDAILFSRSLGRPAGGTPGLLPLGLFLIASNASFERQVPETSFPPYVDFLAEPDWSPVGTQIVARLDTAQGIVFPPDVAARQLHVLSRSGTGVRPLDTPTSAASDPSWSAETGRIAFGCDLGDERNICVVDEDGENFELLTAGATPDLEPAWSPDGSRLLFARDPDNEGGIWIVNADGTGLEQVIPGRASSPAWSPDGTRFVVTLEIADVLDIHVVDLATRATTNLTQSRARDREASWRSP